MAIDTWNEVRTAYQVARVGTVSGAAEMLGVHHATVIRHIDALEQELGVKLFQRHARGYTPTEAGQDLLQVAQATDDQFTQLAGRLRGRGKGVAGDLVVTSVDMMAGLLTRLLTGFQTEHPDVTIRALTSARLFRLEYGEAHVAIRAGRAPDEPDNVVQSFGTLRIGLYGAQSYFDRRGPLAGIDDLARHDFVGPDDVDLRAPFHNWLLQQVPLERVRFRVRDSREVTLAVQAGAGLGFLPIAEASDMPDLSPAMPPLDAWNAPLWLVTHVDLHRTAKVQALLAYLKAEARTWSGAGA